jgi:hypothetical protein
MLEYGGSIVRPGRRTLTIFTKDTNLENHLVPILSIRQGNRTRTRDRLIKFAVVALVH